LLTGNRSGQMTTPFCAVMTTTVHAVADGRETKAETVTQSSDRSDQAAGLAMISAADKPAH